MKNCDMDEVYHTASYIIENYQVKNLVVNMDLTQVSRKNIESEKLTDYFPSKPSFSLSLRHALTIPHNIVSGVEAYYKDKYVPSFNVQTGAYDNSLNDVKPLESLEKYIVKNPTFSGKQDSIKMNSTKECLSDISKIKSLCDEKGINLTVIFSPSYYAEKASYNTDELKEFWTELAGITNFWDFSFSSVSKEPRYFYDKYRMKTAIGNMALAKVFKDPSNYIPQDFGYYVTAENVAERVQLFDSNIQLDMNYTKDISILMYHHIAPEGKGDVIISQKLFESHIKAIYDAGYTTVSFNQLIDYVEKGIELPEKSVVLTFDDGYLSNYEIAYPILKKYNMKATIFVIGAFVGTDTYKDTDYKTIPYFSYAQAQEMVSSGLVSIQSHTYDMHQTAWLEKGKIRKNALPITGENHDNYIASFCADFQKSKTNIEMALQKEVNVFSYPSGLSTQLSDSLLNKMGVKCSVITTEFPNTLVKGLPQSLYALYRYNMTEKITPEQMLKDITH
jgi:peptidoglycan/xylan/chitin deacetylase (PgdA/CDA1 family)